MFRFTQWLVVMAVLGGGFACSTARDPAKGFRLSPNGDPHRGKAAFVEFGCTRCHTVQGARLPQPTIQTVNLGGSVIHQPSDGYLVTAIINPAYHEVQYPAAGSARGGQSQMPEFADHMTVRQLTDIVTYLQTRYALSPVPVPNEYP